MTFYSTEQLDLIVVKSPLGTVRVTKDSKYKLSFVLRSSEFKGEILKGENIVVWTRSNGSTGISNLVVSSQVVQIWRTEQAKVLGKLFDRKVYFYANGEPYYKINGFHLTFEKALQDIRSSKIID